MPQLTPGALLLLRNIPTLGGCVLGFAAIRHLVAAPTWLLVVTFPFMGAFMFAGRVWFTSISRKLEAEAMGARPAPTVEAKRVGGLDILSSMGKDFMGGWLGTTQRLAMEELGSHTINLRLLWDDIIFTADPQHVKTVLASDFAGYEKGESFSLPLGSVLGTGIFNSDGDMWKFHRGISRPFFSRDRISHYELFDTHAMLAMSEMTTRLRLGHSVDIQDLMLRFTLDSATEFLFGSCVYSVTAGLPYPPNASLVKEARPNSERARRAEEFSKAFMDAQEIASMRFVYGNVFPLFEMFKDKTAKPMAVVNAYIEPIIQEALKKRDALSVEDGVQGKGGEKSSEIGEHETLLDSLVKQTSDPVVLRDEVMNILIAGRDTTAATLTFIIYFLCMYPDVMARLREEILLKLGPSQRPTYDDVKDMKYLRAVINETLRLYPVVPFNSRQSKKATTWKSEDPAKLPIYIPANTTVIYSVMLMQRRKDLWGPDAEEFDPDRWIDSRLQTYVGANPFIFLPFNAGPRICIGQQFAYNEMSFMVIRLLQQFSSLSLSKDSPEPPKEWAGMPGRQGVERFNPGAHLTMYATGGLWIHATEVKPEAEALASV